VAINVPPTRMELLRLKKRIELAHRGHRLLQDKLEGLIKEFMPLVNEYVAARDQVDRRLPEVLELTARASAQAGERRIRPALAQTGFAAQVEISEDRRAGVVVPVLAAEVSRGRPFYSLLATPAVFDQAVAELVEVLPLILKATELEQAVRRFAREIERTRRRVNALEYILIPQLHAARKFIQAKLDEDERAARIRSMKVKELLEKAAAAVTSRSSTPPAPGA
jgi:V/A-type H+-transporting ATPase subunit D